MNDCPPGYTPQWSTVPDYMGRICRRTHLSSSIIAIVIGAVCGLLICITFIIFVLVFIKRKKRKKTFRNVLMDETIQSQEFFCQLDNFRLNADNFLLMMNETRRQIRKLHASGDIPGAMSYHPVVRDLAKLLILLNKSNEVIPGPPHDWHRLSSWAEYLLEHHKPQITELIDFFQTPPNISSNDPRLSYCQHSTFKSNITRTTAATTSDSSNEQQNSNLFGSLISLHEFEQPHTTNSYGSTNNIKSSNYFYQSPEINGSSLWLEDEFFKLGFRPQDEITTEL